MDNLTDQRGVHKYGVLALSRQVCEVCLPVYALARLVLF